MDVVMPKTNGSEADLRIVSLKPGLPVIFTTGYATETNLIPIRTREKATVLQKPYGSHYLAQRLREKLVKKNANENRGDQGDNRHGCA
jgi:DNA-binding NtrC family response regulator